jgi:AraC family transcriptional regulator
MFNDSHPAASAVTPPEGSILRSSGEMLARLLATATASLDSDRDTARACIMQATELLRVRQAQETRGQYRLTQGGLPHWQAKRVAAYVEENFSLNIRLTDLADITHLSCSHFSRSFKKSFGETPLAYIMRYRVRRAQLIMLNSRLPLTQIALECGMCDQSHFTRVFRKIVGVNPATWRRHIPGPTSTP